MIFINVSVLFYGLVLNQNDAFISWQIGLYSDKEYDELRLIALQYTQGDNADPYESAIELVTFLPNLRYVLSSPGKVYYGYNYTLTYGGDCKATSILFRDLMVSIGHNAVLDCSIANHHCVTKVIYDGNKEMYQGTYMIVQMTQNPYWAVYNQSVDHWTNWKDYKYMNSLHKEENFGYDGENIPIP